jgi:hypothetical protein
MNPQSDIKLRVLQFALAAVAAVVTLVFLTDAQIASVLGLGTADLADATALLGRLRLVFRLAALFLLLLVFHALFAFIKKKLFPDVAPVQDDADSTIGIVDVDDGIKAAIEAISAVRKPQTIRIWGYSLGWASRLSQHLEGTPHPQLSVEIFVPDETLIGSLFKDPKGVERAAVMRLRLDEWKTLVAGRRVRSVHVTLQNAIPNDLGLMVDDKLALVHAYDWSVEGDHLVHRRQESGRRRFLRVTDADETGRYVIEQLATRFLCRSYDGTPLPQP